VLQAQKISGARVTLLTLLTQLNLLPPAPASGCQAVSPAPLLLRRQSLGVCASCKLVVHGFDEAACLLRQANTAMVCGEALQDTVARISTKPPSAAGSWLLRHAAAGYHTSAVTSEV
jgi:hypothetical protein